MDYSIIRGGFKSLNNSEITGSFGVSGSTFFSGSVTMGGELDTAENAIGGTLQQYTGITTTTDIDWSNGNYAEFTFGSGDETLTFTDPTSIGASIFSLKVVQDGIGSRAITWPSEVLWASGIAPTLSPPALSIDLMYFTYDGTNYLGTFYLDFQ